MSTKFQNKANFQSLYTCVSIYVHTCILPNKPKFQFLYTCIHVYLHTCFLPNEANSLFLNPCILASLYSCFPPNKSIFIPSYPSVPSVAKNMILQNKPNFTIFDLKTRISAQNKANFQFLYPCIPVSLYSYIPGFYQTNPIPPLLSPA